LDDAALGVPTLVLVGIPAAGRDGLVKTSHTRNHFQDQSFSKASQADCVGFRPEIQFPARRCGDGGIDCEGNRDTRAVKANMALKAMKSPGTCIPSVRFRAGRIDQMLKSATGSNIDPPALLTRLSPQLHFKSKSCADGRRAPAHGTVLALHTW
jgi:hypothetical protein